MVDFALPPVLLPDPENWRRIQENTGGKTAGATTAVFAHELEIAARRYVGRAILPAAAFQAAFWECARNG